MSLGRESHPVTTLETAIHSNDVELASSIPLEKIFDMDLERLLAQATHPGRKEILIYLLAQPRIQNLHLENNIHLKIAVAMDDAQALNKFNWQDIDEYTKQEALCKATANGRMNALEFLINHRVKLGLHLNTQISIFPPAIHSAVKFNNMEAVKLLLTSHIGIDVNSRDSTRETALMIGARIGNIDVIKFLLDHGADPKLSYPGFEPEVIFSPLLSAIQHGHLNIAELLLDSGAHASPFDIKRLQTIAKDQPQALVCLGLIAEKGEEEKHIEASNYYQQAFSRGVTSATFREASLFQRSEILKSDLPEEYMDSDSEESANTASTSPEIPSSADSENTFFGKRIKRIGGRSSVASRELDTPIGSEDHDAQKKRKR